VFDANLRPPSDDDKPPWLERKGVSVPFDDTAQVSDQWNARVNESRGKNSRQIGHKPLSASPTRLFRRTHSAPDRHGRYFRDRESKYRGKDASQDSLPSALQGSAKASAARESDGRESDGRESDGQDATHRDGDCGRHVQNLWQERASLPSKSSDQASPPSPRTPPAESRVTYPTSPSRLSAASDSITRTNRPYRTQSAAPSILVNVLPKHVLHNVLPITPNSNSSANPSEKATTSQGDDSESEMTHAVGESHKERLERARSERESKPHAVSRMKEPGGFLFSRSESTPMSETTARSECQSTRSSKLLVGGDSLGALDTPQHRASHFKRVTSDPGPHPLVSLPPIPSLPPTHYQARFLSVRSSDIFIFIKNHIQHERARVSL